MNLLDAGAGSSADLADGDGFLMFDASDSNNAEKVLMSDIKSYVGKMAIQNIDNSGSCVVGMNFFSSHGGHEICTLPASPDVGNIVYIKAASDCSSVNNVSIKKAGSQTIDGQDVIILESPDAAISLCYVEANKWKIF